MRCLLVAVADDPRSKVMFTWVVNHQLKQDDRVHLLHVAMREVSSEGFALPGSDYFDQVGQQRDTQIANVQVNRTTVHDIKVVVLSQFT